MERNLHSPNLTMEIKNINKRGEFLARDFIICLVLFGAVVLLGYLIVVDISSSKTGYNITNMTDEDFEDRYDTLTESSSKIYEMRNETISEEGMSSVSAVYQFFTAGITVISLIFSSISIVNDTFVNFGNDFGIPSAVSSIIFGAIFVIIIAMLVFIIISSVTKGKM